MAVRKKNVPIFIIFKITNGQIYLYFLYYIFINCSIKIAWIWISVTTATVLIRSFIPCMNTIQLKFCNQVINWNGLQTIRTIPFILTKIKGKYPFRHKIWKPYHKFSFWNLVRVGSIQINCQIQKAKTNITSLIFSLKTEI